MIQEDIRVKDIREKWRRWYDARADWDTQAREDIDFYLGSHFSTQEADALAERNQSSMPMDRLYSAIEQFKAITTSKPPKFSVVAREDSDNKLATVWRTLLEYVWDISDGDEVFKQSIHDYSVTGMGYFYAYIDSDADYGRGEVKFKNIDPFRVAVDPNSRNKWFDDAAGMIVSTILTKEQIINFYPQLDVEDKEGNRLIDDIETLAYTDEDYPSGSNVYSGKSFTPDVVKDYDELSNEKYRLLDNYEKVRVPYYRILDLETGKERVLDEARFQMLSEEPEFASLVMNNKIDVIQITQPRVKLTCCVGQVVLFEKILDTDIYPVVPVPNIWTNTPYPMSDVRKNKDFQRYLNKVVSLITSHAQASSGLKLLVPNGSVQDIEELERDWANPNATIEYDASFGEPHFPSPQPLSNSILQLPNMISNYIDLNMGIFEMQQGNPEVAPKTASATMQLEDFGARRSKSKLRDIEGSLKRLGQVVYNLSKSHYTFRKTFRIVQPNNDINEYTVNKRMYDDKTQELMGIENDISVGHFDIRVIGSSTMPSNKWGEWNVYMDAYKLGLIDRQEALKKTEIFDKEGVLGRMDMVQQLQQQLQGAQQQIKKLSGDLQTAHRESIQARKRSEVEKFKGDLKSIELDAKTKSDNEVNKLKSTVELEMERLRSGQPQEPSGLGIEK
tara:strand:+ start:832 stop:2850 length:2019 start_codon:yes stop_codon:yes gene_type:complete